MFCFIFSSYRLLYFPTHKLLMKKICLILYSSFTLASLPNVLGKLMQLLHHSSHNCIHRVINQSLHVAGCLLITKVKPELILYLSHCFVRFKGNIRHIGVHHEREEIEYEVRMTPQLVEGSITQLAELQVELRVRAPHALHHLTAQLHRRRQRFWVPAKDVPEVDMEEVSIACEKQVVEMTVPDPQQVGDDTVASTRTDVSVHHLWGNAIRTRV